MVRWDSADQCTENFEPRGHILKRCNVNGTSNSPSLFLLICVSEKEDFQVPFEAETKGSFYAVKAFILVKTACRRLRRGGAEDSVTRIRAVFVTSLKATKFAPMTRNCLLRHV